MLVFLIILIALIALAVLIAINIVPICIVFFSICGILLIWSPPKHGR